MKHDALAHVVSRFYGVSSWSFCIVEIPILILSFWCLTLKVSLSPLSVSHFDVLTPHCTGITMESWDINWAWKYHGQSWKVSVTRFPSVEAEHKEIDFHEWCFCHTLERWARVRLNAVCYACAVLFRGRRRRLMELYYVWAMLGAL